MPLNRALKEPAAIRTISGGVVLSGDSATR
jgi:hypothetical protein